MPSLRSISRLARILVLPVMLLALAGCSSDAKPATIEVDAPVIPVPVAPDVGAFYFELHNRTDVDDTLTGAEVTGAKSVTLHRSEFTDDGLARMVEIDSVPVPAGADVKFTSGGLHVMIDKPPAMKAGDTVVVTLQFAEAGDLEVEADVIDPSELPEAKHHHG